MQNIHVKRYQTPGIWSGAIEPEDRSWIVFIATDGEASFWRECEATTLDGKTEHAYIDAELPGGHIAVDNGGHDVPPLVSDGMLPRPQELNPLDFTVDSLCDPGGVPVYMASLSHRQVSCEGQTEHEAIRNLLNYVAQLCTAGCLDHTGRAMRGPSTRRYRAVFGE